MMAVNVTDPPVTPPTAQGKNPPSKAVSSVAWLVSETIVARAVAFVSQLVLAYLLFREDFGLFAMTNVVRAFADLIATPGFRTLLIQRHTDYAKLSSPVFWLSLFLGILGAALVGISTLFLSSSSDSALVTKMMFVIALSIPFRAISVLPEAALRIRMQFGEIAFLGALAVVLTATISIVLAYFGFGAMSLVVPFPIVAAVQLSIAWWLTRPKIDKSFSIQDCIEILHDSIVLFTSRVLTVISSNIDYFFLLLFHDKIIVGVYYLAFNLSTQTLRLFSENLVQVLMPSLVHIPQRERQYLTTIRATRAIALIVMPSCFLLALMSEQFIQLCYRPEYMSMVPILQVLCLGMAFRCVGAVSNALLNAQGRFGIVLAFDAITTAIFAVSVAFAAWLGTALEVAVVVSVNVIIRMGFLQQASLKGSNIANRIAVGSYLLPAFLALLSGLAALGVSQFLTTNTHVGILGLSIAKLVTFTAFYVFFAILFMKNDVALLWNRIMSLWPKIILGRQDNFTDAQVVNDPKL